MREFIIHWIIDSICSLPWLLYGYIVYKIGYSNGYSKAEHEWRPQAGWTYKSSQCGWMKVPPKPNQR